MNAEDLKEIYYEKIPPCNKEFKKGSPTYMALERALKLEGDILEAIEPGDPLRINDLVDAYLEYADSAMEQRYIDGVNAALKAVGEAIRCLIETRFKGEPAVSSAL